MEFTSDVTRKDRSINDLIVSVPQPYAEGQTITAGEANALNQVLCENLSNNLRQKLKDGQIGADGKPDANVPHTVETAQALVDEYLAEYEMGVSTGGGRVSDPIEREARNLAEAKAKEVIKAKGKKLKEVNLAQITDAIFRANEEALTAAAKKIVAARSKAPTDDLNVEGLFG